MKYMPHSTKHGVSSWEKRLAYSIFCVSYPMQRGQTALTIVLFFVLISGALGIGFSSLAIKEASIARQEVMGKQAYFLAEAGIEDAVYRIMQGMSYGSIESITLDGTSFANTTINTAPTNITVESEGDISMSIRKIHTRLGLGAGGNLNYGLQVGYLGLDMRNNAQVNGNVYSNGSITSQGGPPLITGDTFVARGLGNDIHVQHNGITSPTSPEREFPVENVVERKDMAQSFTPTITSSHIKIQLYMKHAGTPPPGNLPIKIVADDGTGDPKSSNAFSGSINKNDVTANFSWVEATITVPTAQAIFAREQYWLIVDGYVNGYVLGGGNSYSSGKLKYTENWSNEEAIWTEADPPGDLYFKIFLGEEKTQIQGIEIGDSSTNPIHARAHILNNVVVKGFASSTEIISGSDIQQIPSGGVADNANCDTLSGGSTVHGQTSGCDWSASEDPEPEINPFDIATLDELKNLILDSCPTYGGGDYLFNNDATTTLDCMVYPGNFEISGKGRAKLTGNLYIQGNVLMQNSAQIHMEPSAYGTNDGYIIADGEVAIKNSARLRGDISTDIYLYIVGLSTAMTSPSAILLQNNTNVDALYAANGFLEVINNPTLKTAFGQGMRIQNNSVVNYEIGVANANFSGGPSGGWIINTWREVE